MAGAELVGRKIAHRLEQTTIAIMIRSFIRFDGVKPIATGNQDMPPRGGYPEVVNYITILAAFYFFCDIR